MTKTALTDKNVSDAGNQFTLGLEFCERPSTWCESKCGFGSE